MTDRSAQGLASALIRSVEGTWCPWCRIGHVGQVNRLRQWLLHRIAKLGTLCRIMLYHLARIGQRRR